MRQEVTGPQSKSVGQSLNPEGFPDVQRNVVKGDGKGGGWPTEIFEGSHMREAGLARGRNGTRR